VVVFGFGLLFVGCLMLWVFSKTPKALANPSPFLHKKFFRRRISRKGAKRYRVSQGFLCAFAPLRENHFLPQSSVVTLGAFCASPTVQRFSLKYAEGVG